jgi:dipeptidyl aminopeptidase/acylaminoacyl peptidase|tara:strand:+ start:137 stop:1999 length:1863 start_codon:yes stop_codon:yes gene_type:complete
MRSLLAVFLVLHIASSFAAKPSLKDLLGRATYNDVQISPTGEYLAVRQMEGDSARFTIYKMPERTQSFSSSLGEKSEVARMLWVSDDHLVLTPSRRMFRDVKGIRSVLMSFNAKKNKIENLGGGFLVHTVPEDPKHIIMSWSADQYNVAYRVKVASGRSARKITRSIVPYGGFVADPKGNIVFATGTNVDNELEIHLKKGQEWELLESIGQGEEGWRPFANGPKPNTFLTWDTRDGGTRGLGLFDLETREHKMLLRFGEVDVGPVYRDYNYQVYAVRIDPHFPSIYYLDNSHPLAKVSKALQRNFPDDTITFTSSTRDSSQVIALIQGDRNPGQFVFVDLKAKKVEILFSAKPGLTRDMLAPMLPIQVEARDGHTVHGYMTSAEDTPKPGPMIVYIHGGPYGIRDFWGFNGAVQVMASQGAHVLQVNYRGSGGYGLKYERAGYREWGGLMQDDVTDMTRWAIKSKIADSKRICIYGGSYGAYAAMMGAAKEPDLYRCVVGYSGVYDLTLMKTQGDIADRKSGVAYVHRVIGTDEEELKTRSPVYLADNIKAEVMLIHGAGDRRTPIQHARRMRRALESAGKDVEWVTDGREGHGFAGVSFQVELFEQINAFVKPYLALER